MAISKPTKVIRVHVPRQHAHRLGTKLEGELHKVAKERRIRLDTGQTAALTAAIDSASEWNSLLMTARAERGPQWDVGTQQFLVDKDSALYYDPTELEKLVKPEPDESQSAEASRIQPGPPGPSSSRNSPAMSRVRPTMPERGPEMNPLALGPNPGMPPSPMHQPRRHTPGPPMNYPGYPGGPPGPPRPPPGSQYPVSPGGPPNFGAPPPPQQGFYDPRMQAMGNPAAMGMVPGGGMPPPHGMPMAGMPRPVQPGGMPPMGMGGMPGMGGHPGAMGGMMGQPGMMPGPGYPLR